MPNFDIESQDNHRPGRFARFKAAFNAKNFIDVALILVTATSNVFMETEWKWLTGVITLFSMWIIFYNEYIQYSDRIDKIDLGVRNKYVKANYGIIVLYVAATCTIFAFFVSLAIPKENSVMHFNDFVKTIQNPWSIALAFASIVPASAKKIMVSCIKARELKDVGYHLPEVMPNEPNNSYASMSSTMNNVSISPQPVPPSAESNNVNNQRSTLINDNQNEIETLRSRKKAIKKLLKEEISERERLEESYKKEHSKVNELQDELQKQLLRIEKIATDLFKINKRMDSMDLFNKTLNSTEESPSWMKLEQ